MLDLYLSTARRQNLAAPQIGVDQPRGRPAGGMNVSCTASVKRLPQNAAVTYPSPNEYYDDQTHQRCCTTPSTCTRRPTCCPTCSPTSASSSTPPRAPSGSTCTSRSATCTGGPRRRTRRSASSTEAIQAAPGDHNLLLEVASLREQNNEPDAALALLDSITPLDTQMMQRREEAALRLAERTGNVDRARQAADRLFGLRLDADKQLELAGKMHRLGMHAAGRDGPQPRPAAGRQQDRARSSG